MVVNLQELLLLFFFARVTALYLYFFIWYSSGWVKTNKSYCILWSSEFDLFILQELLPFVCIFYLVLFRLGKDKQELLPFIKFRVWPFYFARVIALSLHCFILYSSGWVKTYESYYTQQVRHILNNMLSKLEQYPKFRFMYAEISFFHIWWNEIDQDKRQRVKK